MPQHKLCQSINCAKALIMPKHKLCKSIYYVKAYIMSKHELCLSINYATKNKRVNYATIKLCQAVNCVKA